MRVKYYTGWWARTACKLLRVQGIVIRYSVLLVTAEPSQELKDHEYAHCLQYQRLGFRFWFKWLYMNMKMGYANNPYEIEANKYADKRRKK